jgi:hypothetical protein
MPLAPGGFVHPQEIESAIERVKSRFAPQVDHINYNFGENWIGLPSIFFRIVVRDEDFEKDRLQELLLDLSISLINEAKTDEYGLYAYFDIMSASGQAKLKEPAWA